MIKRLLFFIFDVVMRSIALVYKSIRWFLTTLKADLDDMPYKYSSDKHEYYKGEKWATMPYYKRPRSHTRVSPEGIKTKFIKMRQPIKPEQEARIVRPGECRYHYDQKSGLQVVMYHRVNDTFLARNKGGKRDDIKRRGVKTWLKPAADGPHDRTHVRPWGYHGFEDDPVLVVGWDSDQNRNELAAFENEVNALNRKEALIWATVIKPTRYGAMWIYEVYNKSGRKKLKTLKLFYGSKYNPKKMWWLKDDSSHFMKR